MSLWGKYMACGGVLCGAVRDGDRLGRPYGDCIRPCAVVITDTCHAVLFAEFKSFHLIPSLPAGGQPPAYLFTFLLFLCPASEPFQEFLSGIYNFPLRQGFSPTVRILLRFSQNHQ